jgi:hypothetical protein
MVFISVPELRAGAPPDHPETAFPRQDDFCKSDAEKQHTNTKKRSDFPKIGCEETSLALDFPA